MTTYISVMIFLINLISQIGVLTIDWLLMKNELFYIFSQKKLFSSVCEMRVMPFQFLNFTYRSFKYWRKWNSNDQVHWRDDNIRFAASVPVTGLCWWFGGIWWQCCVDAHIKIHDGCSVTLISPYFLVSLTGDRLGKMKGREYSWNALMLERSSRVNIPGSSSVQRWPHIKGCHVIHTQFPSLGDRFDIDIDIAILLHSCSSISKHYWEERRKRGCNNIDNLKP